MARASRGRGSALWSLVSSRCSALQNAVALLPVAVLATVMPFTMVDPWKAAGAVAAVVLFNATLCMTLYVRAINNHGAAAVVADAGPASRHRDRRRPRGGRGPRAG